TSFDESESKQQHCHTMNGRSGSGPADREDGHSQLVTVVESVASRAMRPAITGRVVAVTLVPLFMTEFLSFLGLVFTQLGAVTVHLELLLVMVAQTVPFGALVLSLRIFTPISGAAPARSVAIGWIVGPSGRVVHRRRCIVARAIAAAELD